MKQTETALAMVLAATGADYESKEESGLAHFLEHMCFKGTAKRPTAKGIALEFDGIGADYNAFTSRGFTGYHARAHKKHAGRILEMISDIYLNSAFPNAEIQKEKGVIIQEINMYADDPQYKVVKLANEQLYGDQAAGREISGTKESVSALTRDDLLRYRDGYYSAKNTLVVIAGNFDAKAMEKQIKDLFGSMKPGKASVHPKTVVSQEKPDVAVRFKETDQTHLILSFRAFGYSGDKPADVARRAATRSLASILGSGMSSRLFQKMREDLGICYYAHAAFHPRYDTGELGISAGVAHDRVEEALEAIMEEVRKIRDEGVTPEELKKVTEGRLAGLVLHLETTEDYADFYGKEEIIKRKITTAKEAAKIIQGVTLKAVNKASKDVFRKEGINLAIVGPFKPKDQQKFLKIISRI